jgi:hypothetical protein
MKDFWMPISAIIVVLGLAVAAPAMQNISQILGAVKGISSTLSDWIFRSSTAQMSASGASDAQQIANEPKGQTTPHQRSHVLMRWTVVNGGDASLNVKNTEYGSFVKTVLLAHCAAMPASKIQAT